MNKTKTMQTTRDAEETELVAHLTKLARQAHLSIPTQDEILASVLHGIDCFNLDHPGWAFRVLKPVDMNDSSNNVLAQVSGIPIVVVLTAKEIETGKYEEHLRKSYAFMKTESDDLIVMRNLLWGAAVKFLQT